VQGDASSASFNRKLVFRVTVEFTFHLYGQSGQFHVSQI
jgi:hypothetical protein